ncbi:MAG: amino acid permease [Bacteroidota bacterium]
MKDTMTQPMPVREFKRALGLLDSTMIVAGSMIGSGIFIVSADIARQVGSPGWLLVVWLFTSFLTVAAALSYGELAAMMPRAGGQYVYLHEAFGPMWGFLYGWTLFMVIQTGTIAAVAVAFAKYTGVLLPWFSETHIILTVGPLSLSAAQILGIASIAFLTWINTLGIDSGKIVQNTFTFAKIAAIIGLILLGIIVGRNLQALSANFSEMWNASHITTDGTAVPLSGFALITIIGTAMVGSLFASDAWNNITFTAGEVKNPKRYIPLSLIFGTVLVGGLYFLANITYLTVIPLHGNPAGADVASRGIQFATSDRVATAAVEVMFGSAAAIIMAILIMVSTFGCNNGLILAGARVYYAMAHDRLFFRAAGVLNTNGVPARALIVQGFWASILTLSGSYNQLLDYVIFAVLIFYVLTIGGLFVLRRSRPDTERPYRTWGYPFLPAFYMITATLIAVDLLIYKSTYTWPGLIIVLVGIPVFFITRSRISTIEK